MKKTKNEDKGLEEYKASILEQKSKSEDDFEKYITFISSGSLIITLTFVDKISPLEISIYKSTLIIGWCLLAITLLLSLISHYISSFYNGKTIQDINSNTPYDELIKKIKKRNRKISILNICSIISLGIGIFSILIFASINAYNNG